MEDQDRPLPRDPLFEMPTYLLFELGRLVRRTAHEVFSGEPLRMAHALVLACVAADGPLSQREVSERLRLDPGDVVGLVDALEEAGYVERRRDPGDRRRYRLDVTEAGRLFLARTRENRARLNETQFAP
ncbi:MarR family winged helix-turn-helix transcriptional regulator [Actinomadura yumaensis]|nr:MarR family winged helix-turn-helix transcriptional regulator [Actinomadura sp. J1-007]MWK39731.1 MarR family transcriptional regulator [Actinomadura sp. J1-007]